MVACMCYLQVLRYKTSQALGLWLYIWESVERLRAFLVPHEAAPSGYKAAHYLSSKCKNTKRQNKRAERCKDAGAGGFCWRGPH